MSCLALRSRSGVSSPPRKYFETTTLVASCDQNAGTSTLSCLKTTSPVSLLIAALRSSHFTSSKGCTPGVLWRRFTTRPCPALRAVTATSGRDARTALARRLAVLACVSMIIWSPDSVDYLSRLQSPVATLDLHPRAFAPIEPPHPTQDGA